MPDPLSRAPLLDPASFPHVADLIAHHVSASELPRLRLACRALHAAVERRLQEHLVTTPHESSSALLHIWHRGWGYSPHTRTLDVYLEEWWSTLGDGVPAERAGACTLRSLKHLRLISWDERGGGLCAPLVACSAIVPLVYAQGVPRSRLAPQATLQNVRVGRFVLVYPRGPLDIDMSQLHPGERDGVEVVLVVPYKKGAKSLRGTRAAQVARGALDTASSPGPAFFPRTLLGPMPPDDVSPVAASSNFLTISAAAQALGDSGHRLTVVGAEGWVPLLHEVLRSTKDLQPGEAPAIKQLMVPYLELIGCEPCKTEKVQSDVRFLTHAEWEDEVGEEEYALALGACDVRKAYLENDDFRPWAQ